MHGCQSSSIVANTLIVMLGRNWKICKQDIASDINDYNIASLGSLCEAAQTVLKTCSSQEGSLVRLLCWLLLVPKFGEFRAGISQTDSPWVFMNACTLSDMNKGDSGE